LVDPDVDGLLRPAPGHVRLHDTRVDQPGSEEDAGFQKLLKELINVLFRADGGDTSELSKGFGFEGLDELLA